MFNDNEPADPAKFTGESEPAPPAPRDVRIRPSEGLSQPAGVLSRPPDLRSRPSHVLHHRRGGTTSLRECRLAHPRMSARSRSGRVSLPRGRGRNPFGWLRNPCGRLRNPIGRLRNPFGRVCNPFGHVCIFVAKKNLTISVACWGKLYGLPKGSAATHFSWSGFPTAWCVATMCFADLSIEMPAAPARSAGTYRRWARRQRRKEGVTARRARTPTG